MNIHDFENNLFKKSGKYSPRGLRYCERKKDKRSEGNVAATFIWGEDLNKIQGFADKTA